MEANPNKNMGAFRNQSVCFENLSKPVRMYVENRKIWYGPKCWEKIMSNRHKQIQLCIIKVLYDHSLTYRLNNENDYLLTRDLKASVREMFKNKCDVTIKKQSVTGLTLEQLYEIKDFRWMFDSKKKIGIINDDEFSMISRILYPLFVERISRHSRANPMNKDSRWRISPQGVELCEFWKKIKKGQKQGGGGGLK